MTEERDIFEDLRKLVYCDYISDLRIMPYRNRALGILGSLNVKQYPKKQLADLQEYIGAAAQRK